MSRQLAPLALDKRGQPIGFTQLRWSSAQYRWAGFEVQAHRLGPCGRLSDFGVEDTLLGLCLTGRAEMEVGTGKQLHRVVSLPGRFTLLARGYEQKFIAWSGARELLYVSLGTAQLRRFMGRDDDSIQINADPQYAIADPQITRLVLNMRDEILAGCPSGKLYGQCLSLALASRVRARYSGHAERSESSEKCRCGFSPGEVQRLRDYIRAHLTRDIGLAELAGVLGLSAHHFSMLFKQTFGTSPHRYVLLERIRESQKLLASSRRRIPISAVALEMGFADQSHFTHVFRTITGTTPGRYQRNC